jgi:hypothetical protein
MLSNYIDNWEVETPFGRFSVYDRPEKSWHVPTLELVELLKRYSPILSVFSGLALTERAAHAHGVDVLCTDIKPAPNSWCRGTPVMPVMRLRGDKAVRRFPRRNVFMAWPPYGCFDARKCAEQIAPGCFLIYVDEGQYGCNADDSFFRLLARDFELVEQLAIPQFSGMHDGVEVHKRKEA